MPKLITAKTMGGEWWFGSKNDQPYIVKESSDGVDRDPGSNSGVPRPIDQDKYYAHTLNYWTTSGVPWSSTGMTCGTNDSMGNHYWSSYIYGADARNAYAKCQDINHSPLYDEIITRMSFDWVKVDGAFKGENKHHIRCASVGLMYRTGTNSCGTRGWPCPTNEILHRFEKTVSAENIETGSYNKTISGGVKYPIGFWVCIEWQGNGINEAAKGVPKIVIKNLRLGVNTTKDPILTKFQRYTSHTPDDPRPIWTK